MLGYSELIRLGAKRLIELGKEKDGVRAGHCLAEKISLRDVTPLAEEVSELPIFLDALDSCLEIEAAAEAKNCIHNLSVLIVGQRSGHEAFVDLDLIELKACELG